MNFDLEIASLKRSIAVRHSRAECFRHSRAECFRHEPENFCPLYEWHFTTLEEALPVADYLRVLIEDLEFGGYRVRANLSVFYVAEFKAQHDLTDEEFASDHWQTLFAIQYPEAQS